MQKITISNSSNAAKMKSSLASSFNNYKYSYPIANEKLLLTLSYFCFASG